jgi:hypothetical protein
MRVHQAIGPKFAYHFAYELFVAIRRLLSGASIVPPDGTPFAKRDLSRLLAGASLPHAFFVAFRRVAGEAEKLLLAGLAPDMFPLATQIHSACVQAQEGVFRVQG